MKKSSFEKIGDIVEQMNDVQERYNKGKKIKDKELKPMAKMMNQSVEDIRHLLERFKNGEKIEFEFEKEMKVKKPHSFYEKRDIPEELIQSYIDELHYTREQALFALNTHFAMSDTLKDNKEEIDAFYDDIIKGKNPMQIVQNPKNPSLNKKYYEMLLNPKLTKKELNELKEFYGISLKQVKERWINTRLSKRQYKKHLKKISIKKWNNNHIAKI